MTFKLGDKVSIQAHYRNTAAYLDNDDIDINDIFKVEERCDFFKVIDESIPQIEVRRLYRKGQAETGIVCGVRYRTIKLTFEYGRYDHWTEEHDEVLHIEDRTTEKLIMVATKMNTIRLVGEEDIELNL